MVKVRSVFRCSACAYESRKWVGRCPECSAWNTLSEEQLIAEPTQPSQKNRAFRLPDEGIARPTPLSEVSSTSGERLSTRITELDRVLGGGLLPGSLILVGGDPGIGKSTLLLQALAAIGIENSPTLYVSGEESPDQVRIRAERLELPTDDVLVYAETNAARIVEQMETIRPKAVVIDSIQTVFDPDLGGAPGTVGQIREVAARFLYSSKSRGIPTFLVGHVTKHGEIAGPRVLEHMVDTVLYFEEASGHPYRILRAHKNRFGSTNEIGVFEMRTKGLEPVENPSELFLSERPVGTSGSAVLPAIEGTRPVLVEVQALVSPSSFGTPRRTCLGFDSARAALLVAILERRAGLSLAGCDVFVNVAGGLSIADPAADLAVAAALASSLRDRPISRDVVMFGEIGLSGELRGVSQPEARLAEAHKLGFLRAIVPEAVKKRLAKDAPIEVIAADRLYEALEAAIEG
ncbi:MAG: DNA repair protein RadA [Deltaproteobacteria bacterium]|nr:DNA repair protein RadA [Deltaproteobacteria bacterium]